MRSYNCKINVLHERHQTYLCDRTGKLFWGGKKTKWLRTIVHNMLRKKQTNQKRAPVSKDASLQQVHAQGKTTCFAGPELGYLAELPNQNQS